MRILRGVLGKNPSRPKGRVRNFIANKELARCRTSMKMSSVQV